MSKGKVLFWGSSRVCVYGFRGELIERLKNEGYEVVVSFPNGPYGEGEEISKQYGCKFIETQIERRGKNPAHDLALLYQYIKIIKGEKPNYVLGYTVKCDIYGGIACRLTGTPFIANITGLGKGLAEGGATEFITKNLYKIAMKKAKCVFFQNKQDKGYFDRNNIRYKKARVIPGSGVNVSRFSGIPYPADGKTVFTYMSRVMKAKGIDQFLDAAHKLYSDKVEFHIFGYCEEDYKGILEKEQEKGIITYHGFVGDVTEAIKMSHCIVSPSFHPEGISNVLLEAAASARPIITTDNVGCKETVNDGMTGYIVKQRDSDDLIEKMKTFLKLSYEQKKEMGVNGRQWIMKKFDRNIVVDAYIDELTMWNQGD